MGQKSWENKKNNNTHHKRRGFKVKFSPCTNGRDGKQKSIVLSLGAGTFVHPHMTPTAAGFGVRLHVPTCNKEPSSKSIVNRKQSLPIQWSKKRSLLETRIITLFNESMFKRRSLLARINVTKNRRPMYNALPTLTGGEETNRVVVVQGLARHGGRGLFVVGRHHP